MSDQNNMNENSGIGEQGGDFRNIPADEPKVWNVPPQDGADYKAPYQAADSCGATREAPPAQPYNEGNSADTAGFGRQSGAQGAPAPQGNQSAPNSSSVPNSSSTLNSANAKNVTSGQQPYQWNFADYDRAQTAPAKKKNKGARIFMSLLGAVLAVSVIAVASIGIYKGVTQETPGQQGSVQPEQPPASTLPGITIKDRPVDESMEVLPDGKLTSQQIIKKVAPSVVAITTYINYQDYQAEGMGSGIIIREDGYIVTNAHVVDGAKGITVQLSDGETKYEGRVVGTDQKTDLAVIKVDATGLSAATFSNSDQVEMGEKVLAIGNPQGMDFAGSVTQGIVSGLNRQVVAGGTQVGSSTTHYRNLIQTDAAINPGNSGGALVNEYGQVIGINSAKVIAEGSEGMGFAIPANQAKPIVDDLINHGHVTGRVLLGIQAREIDEVLARLNHVPVGLVVDSTEEGSDISRKGVVPGDIITKVNDNEITSLQILSDAITGKKPGDTVRLEVYRPSDRSGGKGRFFDITVALIEDMGTSSKAQAGAPNQTLPSEQNPETTEPEQSPSPDTADPFEDFFNRFFN